MSFIAPYFLFLLPLAIIPLILHILYKRNIQSVDFSTLRFLKELEVDTIKNLKFLELLLLIIRILIILLLVAMISRPVYSSYSTLGYSGGNQPIYSSIIIDNSFSISRSGNMEFISEDIFFNVQNIIENMPPKSKMDIYLTSSDKAIFSGYKEEFKGLNNFISLEGHNNNIVDFVDSILPANTEYSIRELYILSDSELSSNAELGEREYSNWSIYYINNNYINKNISINSLDIKNEIVALNRTIDIYVEVQNTASLPVDDVLLILNVDSMNLGQQSISLKPGEVSTVVFRTLIPEKGLHYGKIISDNDDFKGDNYYYFTLNIQDNSDVGLVNASRVESSYFKNALNSINSEYNNITINNINPLESQYIFLNNQINVIFGYNYIDQNNLWELISEYLYSGGKIYVFPLEEDFDLSKSDFLENIGVKSDSIRLRTIPINADNAIYPVNLHLGAEGSWFSNNDLDGEIFKINKFLSFPVSENSQIIKDNISLWEKIDIYDGELNIFSFLLYDGWTDLIFKPPYIAFVNNMITNSLYSSKYNLTVGDSLFFNSPESVAVTNSDGKKYKINKNPYLIEKSGIYLIAGDGTQYNSSSNHSYDELYSNKIKRENIEKISGKIIYLDGVENLEIAIKEMRVGVELWKYLLYIACILLIVESFISNRKESSFGSK